MTDRQQKLFAQWPARSRRLHWHTKEILSDFEKEYEADFAAAFARGNRS
jgi:hypothetical protein